jgi:site-specific DNA recombinase
VRSTPARTLTISRPTQPLISTDLYERAQRTVKRVAPSVKAAKHRDAAAMPTPSAASCGAGCADHVMEGSVNHGRIDYRRKASRDYVNQHGIAHRVLSLRQESITDPVDRFLRPTAPSRQHPAQACA